MLNEVKQGKPSDVAWYIVDVQEAVVLAILLYLNAAGSSAIEGFC